MARTEGTEGTETRRVCFGEISRRGAEGAEGIILRGFEDVSRRGAEGLAGGIIWGRDEGSLKLAAGDKNAAPLGAADVSAGGAGVLQNGSF